MAELESLISFENVTFHYPSDPDKTPVLSQVNLELYAGDFVAVIGHNGSGKSTLAKHLNALLQPSEGKVTIVGLDSAVEDNWLPIRRQVGMVFQNPDNQIVATVVEEDVAFSLENLGVESSEIRRRVDEALRLVGMYDYREHAPHRLSGGQKQRVAIAGVIAMQPKILVLDEPTAMLDPQGRQEVMQTIRMLGREHGITVVLITHHMQEAADCDRVLVMDRGRPVLDGPPREIFSRLEELESFGLSAPQGVELLHALRREGLSVSTEALDIEDCVKSIARALGA